MYHKSSTRVYSELALLRKQQWMGTISPGGPVTERNHVEKLALLRDEHEGMKDSFTYSTDNVVSNLLAWSRKIMNLLAEEEALLCTWVKCATEESSVNPISQVLRTAEHKLEGLVSEAKNGLKSSSDEQLSDLKKNLMKSCRESKVSFVVKELALAALKVARVRLSDATKVYEQFAVIKSGDYLKKLEDGIKSKHPMD
jgi:hypothetical protein